LLPAALGFADGILNALTLASGALIGGGEGRVTVSLAARVAVAAFVTAGFAVFVAEYADARGTLRHGARQLNMSSERALADTDLGRSAIRYALAQSALASAASLLGALLPLLLATALPGPPWIAAVIAILALGFLGAGLATVVLGTRVKWAGALLLGGVCVTAIGVWIHIVG
jgi:VIT1/CCC1 family predicted Fe2+/Mn2+ transporter